MTAVPALLRSVLSRTSRRIRAQRALEAGSWALAFAAAIAAAHRLFSPLAPTTTAALGLAVLACAAVSLLRRLPAAAVAHEIDRRAALAGRVSAALEFSRVAADARSPFMEAALRDAERHAARVQPREVAPLALPRARWLALAALIAWGVVQMLAGALSADSAARVVSPRTAPISARIPLAGELRVFEQAAERLARQTPDHELAPELERYRAALRELSAGRSTREQMLSELFALEEALGPPSRGGRDQALVEALARELTRLGGGAGEPGSAGTQARDALRELASSLQRDALDAAAREALARALARIRAERAERADGDDESVLKKRAEGARSPGSTHEQSVLEQKRRELEQLRRERAEAAPARRALERLQRELDQARSALGNDQASQAGEALARGEQALSQLENARALQREIEQLREQLQREQSGGSSGSSEPEPSPQAAPGEARNESDRGSEQQEESLAQRRERFRLRALGEPAPESSGDAGLNGHAMGEPGDGGAAPTAQQGRGGSPQAGGELSTLGGSGVELLVPRNETAAGGAGDEHDESRGAPSPRSERGYEDRALAGARSRGPTRSQVIRGAARGGFATAAYRRVYGDYRAHAEQLIERDDVPPGYRYYVRRYFQLVRPRDGEEAR